MKTKKFKVIGDREINVNAKKRQPAEVFEEVETQELKNLVFHKYLEVVVVEKQAVVPIGDENEEKRTE